MQSAVRLSSLLFAAFFSGATLFGGALDFGPAMTEQGSSAKKQEARPGYTDTPMLPGGKWHVHDPARPYPRVVRPGASSSGDAPSDAIVLFDGKDLKAFQGKKGPAEWKLEDGAMIANRSGSIQTKKEFGDIQLHVEYRMPVPAKGKSQGRGNSGIYLMGRYEVQVLDSYENPSYADGQCAAIYGQCPPLVNACRKPGEWQSYDIVFEAPRFREGKLLSPAFLTVFHNGICVHNRKALIGRTAWRTLATYAPHGPRGPILLQDHGNPVAYRNLWVRELGSYDAE